MAGRLVWNSPQSVGQFGVRGDQSTSARSYWGSMRVYLPSTLADLASALVAGEVGPAPVLGYAVTPALREWYASGDLEELEYVALMQAARASLRLLHEQTTAARRRVVLAAEVADVDVMIRNGFDKPGKVEVMLPVRL